MHTCCIKLWKLSFYLPSVAVTTSLFAFGLRDDGLAIFKHDDQCQSVMVLCWECLRLLVALFHTAEVSIQSIQSLAVGSTDG